MLGIQFFTGETLGDTNTGNRFVKVAIDQRQPLPCGAVGITYTYPPLVSEDDHQRQHRKCDQRQFPIHDQHSNDDANENKE